MPSLRSVDHEGVRDFLGALESGAMVEKAGAPRGYYGSGWAGGPSFVDAFRSRRAPSPPELVEAFKSVCYSCAYLNANGVARVPLRLYATTTSRQARPRAYTRAVSKVMEARFRKSSDYAGLVTKAESIDEVVEHPLLDAMAEVNDDFDTNLLMLYTVLCMDITGAAYWLPEANGLGVPGSLWPLQAQYVIPTRLSNKASIDYFQYFSEMYRPDQLVRCRHVSMKDPYGPGYGPTQACYEQLGLGDKFVTVTEQLLGNGLRPSIIISPKDGLTGPGRDEGKRYEVEVNSKLSGAGQGRAWFIDGAVNVDTISFPPGDLADLEISKNAMGRAANCFGVPISLLQTEDVNLANAEAGKRQHSELAVEPRCIRIASGLTKWTRNEGKQRPQLGWERLFWAFDTATSEDIERRTKVFAMQTTAGKITVNEWRAEDGQPAVAWGDEPWLSDKLRQPSEERPKPAAPPGKPDDEKPPEPGAASGDDDQGDGGDDR
jgi:phage portal protein BeeE